MSEPQRTACIDVTAGEISWAQSEAAITIEKAQAVLDHLGAKVRLRLNDRRHGIEGDVQICADASSANDWRPIETAPSDGSRLWLSGWQPPSPSGVRGYWWVDVGMYVDGEWWSERTDGPLRDTPPIHWQPLPAPPEKAEPDQ